jgi:membrane protease YdiL (CAAX protease family)
VQRSEPWHAESDPRGIRPPGLRAGRRPGKGLWWRVSVIFLATTATWWVIYQGLNRWFGPVNEDRTGHAVRAILALALGTVIVALALRHLEEPTWQAVGLTSLPCGMTFLGLGFLGWLTPVAVALAVAAGRGGTSIEPMASWPTVAVTFVGMLLAVASYEAFPEELIFRGYLYSALASRMPRAMAVAGQALLFLVWGVVIGAANTPYRMVVFLVFALVCGVLRAVTGSVWTSIGFHLAFQSVEQTLSSTSVLAVTPPDSYQSVGPIGLFLLPLVLLIWAAVRPRPWLTRRRGSRGASGS